MLIWLKKVVYRVLVLDAYIEMFPDWFQMILFGPTLFAWMAWSGIYHILFFWRALTGLDYALTIATVLVFITQLIWKIWIWISEARRKGGRNEEAVTIRLKSKQWWIIWLGLVAVSWLLIAILFKLEVIDLTEWTYGFLWWRMISTIAIYYYLFSWIKEGASWLREKWVKRQQKKQNNKKKKRVENEKRWRLIWKILGWVLILWLIVSSVVTMSWFMYDSHPGGHYRFSVLHAAIKNTCLLDPRRENCPRTLEEISYIEPEVYYNQMVAIDSFERDPLRFFVPEAKVQTSYDYDPVENEYTWVIRYRPERAIIFDQRLAREKGSNGLDFREYMVDVMTNRIIGETPAWIEKEWLEFPEWF